eukprot:scaffold304643_cov28-Tisochrysis_lutea.AAC.1
MGQRYRPAEAPSVRPPARDFYHSRSLLSRMDSSGRAAPQDVVPALSPSRSLRSVRVFLLS